MANEITITCSLASTKANATLSSGSQVGQFDMSGLDVDGGSTQNVGTTDEAISIPGDIGTIGALEIKHLGVDSTGAATSKYVEVSYDTGGSFDAYKFAKLRAGVPIVLEPAFPTGKTAIYARAESGATNGVQIKKWIVEA